MKQLPTGTVFFLFTDIEGSTRLLQNLGPSYRDVLETHQRLMRTAFAAHEGIELSTEGDSFMVVFAHARQAVAAVVDPDSLQLEAGGGPAGAGAGRARRDRP